MPVSGLFSRWSASRRRAHVLSSAGYWVGMGLFLCFFVCFQFTGAELNPGHINRIVVTDVGLVAVSGSELGECPFVFACAGVVECFLVLAYKFFDQELIRAVNLDDVFSPAVASVVGAFNGACFFLGGCVGGEDGVLTALWRYGDGVEICLGVTEFHC